MIRWLVRIVGSLAALAVAAVAFILVAMRTRSPWMLGAVRRFNRDVTNKFQRSVAGRPGAYASVIRHQGRTSGTSYETPVVPFPVDDGFLIPLPYGTTTDWLQNVLAAGSAVLVTEGHTYDIDEPQLIATADVAHLFPPAERRTHRIFGVEHCVSVRRADEFAANPT